MANKRNGTLYIGVTNNLIKRVNDHKSDIIDGFTKRYKIHTLVYFYETIDIKSAIIKEKQIKKWKRIWKLKLIEDKNPNWKDLSYNL